MLRACGGIIRIQLIHPSPDDVPELELLLLPAFRLESGEDVALNTGSPTGALGHTWLPNAPMLRVWSCGPQHSIRGAHVRVGGRGGRNNAVGVLLLLLPIIEKPSASGPPVSVEKLPNVARRVAQ